MVALIRLLTGKTQDWVLSEMMTVSPEQSEQQQQEGTRRDRDGIVILISPFSHSRNGIHDGQKVRKP
jgi:hypothetical protein